VRVLPQTQKALGQQDYLQRKHHCQCVECARLYDGGSHCPGQGVVAPQLLPLAAQLAVAVVQRGFHRFSCTSVLRQSDDIWSTAAVRTVSMVVTHAVDEPLIRHVAPSGLLEVDEVSIVLQAVVEVVTIRRALAFDELTQPGSNLQSAWQHASHSHCYLANTCLIAKCPAPPTKHKLWMMTCRAGSMSCSASNNAYA